MTQTHEAARTRPPWLIPAIVGAVVVVIAVVVAVVLGTRDGGTVAAAPTSTVVVPSPTPTVEPVARAATTPFAALLPTTVLQYALATSAEDPEWVTAGALEAYVETFTDGGSGTVTVRAGQWETAEAAAAQVASLVSALPAAPAATATAAPSTRPASGDVEAGGAVVGTYTIVDTGDGTGTAVWNNTTAVFQVTGPADDIADLFAAFGV